MDEYLQLFGRVHTDPAAADPSMHPLMTAAQGNSATQPPSQPHSRGSHRRALLRGPGVVAADPSGVAGGLANMLQDLIGQDGFQLVEQMMVRGGGSTEAILEIRPSGGGPPISVAQLVNPQHTHRSSAPTTEAPLDPVRQVTEFTATTTPHRWIDEGKMTQGRYAGDRITTLVNYVICALLPEARAHEVAREAKEAEERTKREAEAEARSGAEVDGGQERPTDANDEAIEGPSDVSIPPSGEDHPEPSSQLFPRSPTEIPSPINPDVEMMDTVSEPHAPNGPETGPVSSVAEEPEPAVVLPEDSTPSNPAAEAPDTSEAGPSEAVPPAARVIVSVHGSPVDITDTGIDPTFLEALPDDMRQDVINEHMRERRAAEPVVRPEESQISPEFLDALPPEIRAEILQQEQDALDRARRERERAANPNIQQGGPSDIDSASFLASLDPALRQAVLMEQDEGFLQTLPSALLAEASALFTESLRRTEARTVPANNAASTSTPRKPATNHEAIQLLDKAGVATLVRMLFFPQVLRKSPMHKVLANLCENSKTRADLFNLLLGVLQDGSVDVGAVDRSFSQLSFRTAKPHATASKTPTKARADSYNSLPEPSPSNPNLITQRSLDALAHIVNANDAASLYFLSEQEALPGSKRPSTRKGKAKEKPLPSTHYPVVLLLALLDRESLLKSPAMMGMVAQLLANVTRPLSGLKEPAAPAPPDTSGPNSELAPVATEAQATQPESSSGIDPGAISLFFSAI